MMHSWISVFVIFASVWINAEISPLVKYKDVCEKINVDMLLRNQHLASFYMKCLLDKSACNREGLIIRSVIPEILSTSCANCTEKEKEIVQKSMNFIYTTSRADFEKIYNQFDPHRIHRTSIMKFMNDGAAPLERSGMLVNN